MSTILITGASRGIGYETARILVRQGHSLWLGARDPERGERAAAEVGGRFVRLDVTDDASVAAGAAAVGEIDVLVNNAGVLEPPTHIGDLSAELVKRIFDTNIFGAVRMMTAFLPLLLKSEQAAVVNVTSSIGSVAKSADPWDEFNAYPQDVYRSSKAALNMFTVQYAKAYPAIRINCVDPGLTATDMMGRGSASRRPPRERSSRGWPRSVRMRRPGSSLACTAPSLVTVRVRARQSHHLCATSTTTRLS